MTQRVVSRRRAPGEKMDMPSLAGFNFRAIRGVEDADVLHAVHTGRATHDAVDPFSTSEDFPSLGVLRESLGNAVAAGCQDRWLVAEAEGHVVGYSQLESWPEADGTWVYLTLGWVLPAWRGQGLGTTMLHWTEGRLRQLAAEEHPSEKAEFAANASSTEREATALLAHEGYRAEYTVLEMGLDLAAFPPAQTLPSGLEVRPVLPDHYTLIAHSVDEAYQYEYTEGRFNEDIDPATYVTWLGQPKHDPSLWKVAWDGEQIAGQVLSRIDNGCAEVLEVSVRPAWRRRGLARGLLSRALHTLRARDIDVIRLRTVAEFRTRARDLYQSVGFRVLKEFPRYRKAF